MSTGTADVENDSCIDGRVLRGQRNREAIVDALLDTYASGNLRPTAAQVAETAGLSTRSVYHHFDDMKSLILEVIDRSEKRVTPVDFEALSSVRLPDRIVGFVEHRFDRWSMTGPVIRAGLLAEYDSKLVAELIRLGQRNQIAELRVVFGREIEGTDDPVGVVAGLDVVFGFEMWHRLTHTRDLDHSHASAIVVQLASALL